MVPRGETSERMMPRVFGEVLIILREWDMSCFGDPW